MSFEKQYLKKGIYKEDKLIKWTAIFLWKIDPNIILKGLKFWMTALSHLKLQNFSITVADFAESQCSAHISCKRFQLLWWTSWPPSPRFYVLSVKFHFPVVDTRPCPSTTGHGNAGNNQGQVGLHLTPHICKSFHGPHRPALVSQSNNLPASWAGSGVTHSHVGWGRKLCL